jgi:hypothetical protein
MVDVHEPMRHVLFTLIPPALFLSGSRSGAKEGGEPGDQCADVYRVDNLLSSPRVCSPSMLTVELWFPAAAVLLHRQMPHPKILNFKM